MPETASPAPASPQDAEIAAALGTRCVVLIGMMGAGKSTIGRRLAARLRLPFLDADIEIEAAAGMSIPDIFETHGEPDFRDGEARVIARLLDSGPAVVATGGGAFMREETRNRIRDKAVSIWLKADAEIIMRRVRAAPTGRCCRPRIPPRPSTACSASASRSTRMPTSRSGRATCRTKRSSTNASRRCTPGFARRDAFDRDQMGSVTP
jgi:shikimate kinase